MIFTFTPALAQGRFVGPDHVEDLRAAGITHILNVCQSPPIFGSVSPFEEIAWHPLEDDRRLTEAEVHATLTTLHGMVSKTASRVYVHCIAGWIRSPTIIWLYLVACGGEPRQLAREIVARNPNASPGVAPLVSSSLLDFVRELGRANFLPHPRTEALEFLERDA